VSGFFTAKKYADLLKNVDPIIGGIVDCIYKQTILKSFDVEHYRKKERKAVYM
jgi:hypothetical protein